jgi:hypothetical protein
MERFETINISDYLNHRMIAPPGDFSPGAPCQHVAKDMFDPKTLPPSSALINVDDVPHVFPDKLNFKYDNISCEGQTIDIPTGAYRSIHILGLSHLGDHTEEAVLFFKGNVKKTVKISFIDWCYGMRWEYEKRWISFKPAIIGNDTFARSCSIYQCNIRFDFKGLLYGMRVPNNPCLHFFSITLKRL